MRTCRVLEDTPEGQEADQGPREKETWKRKCFLPSLRKFPRGCLLGKSEFYDVFLRSGQVNHGRGRLTWLDKKNQR